MPDPTLEQIEWLLREKRIDEASPLLEQLLAKYSDDVRLNQLLAVVRAKQGRDEEAGLALKRVTELAPTDADAFYHYGVYFFDRKEYVNALQMASQALSLRPLHKEARALMRRCGAMGAFKEGEKGDVLSKAVKRVPFVEDAGVWWLRIGYGVFWLDLIGGVARLIHSPFSLVGTTGIQLVKDPFSMITFFLLVVGFLASMIWTLIDIIDKRDKFMWIVPVFAFAFCGLQMLPIGLYLYMAKKQV